MDSTPPDTAADATTLTLLLQELHFAARAHDERVRAAPDDRLSEKVQQAVETALMRAGAQLPVRVEVVDEIAREPGHAAKVKLVVSEVGRPSEG